MKRYIKFLSVFIAVMLSLFLMISCGTDAPDNGTADITSGNNTETGDNVSTGDDTNTDETDHFDYLRKIKQHSIALQDELREAGFYVVSIEVSADSLYYTLYLWADNIGSGRTLDFSEATAIASAYHTANDLQSGTITVLEGGFAFTDDGVEIESAKGLTADEFDEMDKNNINLLKLYEYLQRFIPEDFSDVYFSEGMLHLVMADGKVYGDLRDIIRYDINRNSKYIIIDDIPCE